MRIPTLRVLALLLGLLVGLTGPAAADQRADAKAHYVKGKSLFDAKDYVNAIAEFKTADQLAPSAVNDYNVALAYDALGDETQAISYYQSYLSRMPDAANKGEVQGSIRRLEAVKAADAAAADEAARRAAEDRRMPPPNGDPVGDPPVDDPMGTSSTGDPELDRASGIDVNAIRDQRGGTGGTVAVAGGGPPPPSGGGAPPPAEQPKKSKPIYKQWWFWVVAGVSAYVLISILASDSDSPQPGGAIARPLPPMPDGFSAGGGGASIFSF